MDDFDAIIDENISGGEASLPDKPDKMMRARVRSRLVKGRFVRGENVRYSSDEWKASAVDAVTTSENGTSTPPPTYLCNYRNGHCECDEKLLKFHCAKNPLLGRRKKSDDILKKDKKDNHARTKSEPVACQELDDLV